MKCSWTDFMDFSWIICSLKFNLCSSIFIKYSWTNLLNFSWTDKFVKQSIVFSWRIHECSWTTKLIQKKFMNWFIVHHNSLYVHEPNSWISMNNGSWTTFEIFHELNMNYSWTFMNIHEWFMKVHEFMNKFSPGLVSSLCCSIYMEFLTQNLKY